MNQLIVFIMMMLINNRIDEQKLQRYIHKKNVENLIIYKENQLLYQSLASGTEGNYSVPIHSITKSILSILIGIGIEKGFIKSIDQPLSVYFKAELNNSLDPRMGTITLKNLLTMTSGIPYRFGNEVDQKFIEQKNPVREILTSTILEAPPGEQFCYKEIEPHLLSAVLTKSTNMSTFEFAQKYLFQYLDMNDVNWKVDNQGVYYGGSGLKLTPTDLLKIGQVYLNNGKYQQIQIVHPNWINDSTRVHVMGTFPINAGYGYYWWISKVSDHHVFFAFGAGGQFIYCIPALSVVIVITTNKGYGVWS